MLELRGGFAADAPCVYCGTVAWTAFRAEGLPGAPMLPLHMRCGGLLIADYRAFMDGGGAEYTPPALRAPREALGPGDAA